MRIADIESRIIGGDCSEETLGLFTECLKRVPKNLRCQHCYLTAAAMPPGFFEQALDLIQYGMTNYCNSWVDSMRSYYNMAVILESRGDFLQAQKSYQKALGSIKEDMSNSYQYELAFYLMRTEMFINHFEYTVDLEIYYNLARQADNFNQSFKNRLFYRLLAEIIISIENNNLLCVKKALSKIRKIIRPEYQGPLTKLLKKHQFYDTITATEEALAYLERIESAFDTVI